MTPRADSIAGAPGPAPAPLLIPGRPYVADTLRRSTAEIAFDFYRKGRVLEMDGNPQAALAAYRSAVGLDPTIPGIYYRIGRLYEAFGAVPEAMQAYAAEVQQHPEDRDAARALGVALVRVGETDRAIQQLELLVRRDSRDGPSWRALGYAYTHAHRYRDAEQALRTAIRIPPEDAEEYRDLGVLLANLDGREREARDAYLRAAKLDPKDASALINLGNLELRMGRPDDALVRYREAESRDSLNVFVYHGQVRSLAGLGRSDESGDVYRRWVSRAPDDEGARLEAVRHFVARDRTDIALELARDGVRLNRRSGQAHATLGVAYGGAGDARSALEEFRIAEQLFQRGRPEEAERVRAMIAELRAGAPDSLRTLFVQDSLRAATPPARVDAPGGIR